MITVPDGRIRSGSAHSLDRKGYLVERLPESRDRGEHRRQGTENELIVVFFQIKEFSP